MSKPTKETTAAETALLAQQELLESCLELVFETREAARTDSVADPVILLIDCEDALGAEIANAWLGAAAVRNAIAERQLDDPAGEVTTVYARAFSWAESRREVPLVFDYLAPVFETPAPVDGFLAIAVTAGGASAFTVPLSASNNPS